MHGKEAVTQLLLDCERDLILYSFIDIEDIGYSAGIDPPPEAPLLVLDTRSSTTHAIQQ